MKNNLTDQKLFDLCLHYGKLALHYRRKFIGLLPEVSRRRLYEQKGFNSIFEFAYKLAGLSEAQVKRALSLDQKFADKPILRDALTSGKISINKLARVASVATVENQKYLYEQVKVLPKDAVETLARDMKEVVENNLYADDMKFVPGHKLGIQNGLFDTHDPAVRGKCVSISKIQNLNLSNEVIAKLCELQNKGVDINELILNFLEEREEKIAQTKEILAREQDNKVLQNSRYIPAKIRKIIVREHGTKCSIPHCRKPAQTIHHTARFTLSQSHNPHFLAPLCQEHHILAHSLDTKFHRVRQK